MWKIYILFMQCMEEILKSKNKKSSQQSEERKAWLNEPISCSDRSKTNWFMILFELAIRGKWLWNLTKVFVVCLCSLFVVLTV